MRKKLLVSGCSWTEHDFDNDGIEKRWCHYVADKLDMDLVNLGRRGAGNEYIFSSIYDYIENNDNPDMIIAAWSKSQRRDYQHHGRWINDREDHRGDVKYHLKKTQRYQNILELVCGYHKITYKSFQMLELVEKNKRLALSNISVQNIVITNFTEDRISDTNHHPSAIGHEKLGKYIYENL